MVLAPWPLAHGVPKKVIAKNFHMSQAAFDQSLLVSRVQHILLASFDTQKRDGDKLCKSPSSPSFLTPILRRVFGKPSSTSTNTHKLSIQSSSASMRDLPLARALNRVLTSASSSQVSHLLSIYQLVTVDA